MTFELLYCVEYNFCHLICTLCSLQIILRLPDEVEVADELWDDVIDCMMLRVRDKVPVIRTFAVRSLSRFVNDPENSDILDLLLEVLPLEQNPVKWTS